MNYKVGQKVFIRNPDSSIDHKLVSGVIKNIDGEMCAFECELRINFMHDCNGFCKPLHGWWILKKEIVKLCYRWKKI